MIDEVGASPFETLEFDYLKSQYDSGDTVEFSYALTPGRSVQDARQLASLVVHTVQNKLQNSFPDSSPSVSPNTSPSYSLTSSPNGSQQVSPQVIVFVALLIVVFVLLVGLGVVSYLKRSRKWLHPSS
jgi:hypothetical protein